MTSRAEPKNDEFEFTCRSPHRPDTAPYGDKATADTIEETEKTSTSTPEKMAAVGLPGEGNSLPEGSSPSDDHEDGKKKDKTPPVDAVPVNKIFKYADWKDSVLMVVGALAAIGAGAGMPAFSFIMGMLINDLNGSGNVERKTAKTALIMVYVGIGIFTLSAIYVSCWMVAACRQVARIRLMYFHAVLRQEMGWHDEHKPGELTSRMTGDTRVLQNGINDKLANGIMNAAMGICGFIFGFISCWELTLVLIGMVPFLAVMGGILGSIMAKMTQASRKHFAVAGSMATEVMENIRTVQTFGKEEYEVGRFHKAVQSAQAAGIKKEVTTAMTAGITMGIVFLTYTVTFFFASYLILWERTDVGKVVATFYSVLLGSFGLGFVAPSLTSFTESRAAAYHLYETIDRTPPIDIDAVGEPVSGFSDAIEFRNVEFSYPTRPDMVLFRDLCLTIKKGHKVAFSGASGCGKSSIIGLLQRFYDPSAGGVFVDGRDMRSLTLKEWRDQIGIVSQEPNLFAGSMIDNVRVGKADATMEEVIEACKQANIHDTIMGLPDQYETAVGAVGSQLSGGQKQRIAIARAIIKKPPILLLDEATSALDRKSEMEVQAALDDLMKGGMTVIIVAHRLATIRNVDCIYFVTYDGVKGSTISESGTFDELVALKGQFAAMAKTQGAVTEGPGSSPVTAQEKGFVAGHVEYLDDVQLAMLDAELPRTERQQVPIEKLAAWEVKNANSSMMRVMRMNFENLWAVVLGVIGSAITGALGPCNSILFGKILAVFGKYGATIEPMQSDRDALRSGTNLWASLFLVISAAAVAGWGMTAFYGVAGERLTTKIRTLLLRQILRQDMSFFDIPGRDAGTLSGMLSGDCEAVHQLWGPSIGFKVQTAFAIGTGLIIGFCYQWKLACVAMACLPLVAVCNFVQQILMMGFTQSKEGDMDDTIVTEALSNVRTVTSFNLKDNRVAAYFEVVNKEAPRSLIKNILIGVVYGATQFVFYGVFALCFWYGGKLMDAGEATFEGVMITSMAVLMGAMGAGEAGGFASKMADADKASRRVFSVIDRVPDVDVYDRKDTEIGSGCSIGFRRVRFIYPARPKQVVLQSVDLQFAEGSANGLMGQTGCGKSTIIQMLARFYDNRGGSVTVNGKALQDLDIATWRKSISIVLQEPSLFSGTVRENIRYSREDATDEEVEEAARIAQIHDDIMRMPEGYDTDVGYKGRALSGGQKQRVAIARGILRRPKLLLLDEATSALDNVTETAVQKGLDEYQRKHGVTTVSIAHRLTTIRHCDQIILLDTGRILEQGSHDELMALNGEYKVRWELYANSTE